MAQSHASRPGARRGAAAVFVLLSTLAGAAHAQPCLIFVHGHMTDNSTATSWSAARSYWKSGAADFVATATRGFTASSYVIGYDGTQPYWSGATAGVVASGIVNATNGGADGGGNRCARTWAQGGTFWVVAHSMGGAVLDFILGNGRTTDPNYSTTFGTAAQRVGLVVAVSAAHRG